MNARTLFITAAVLLAAIAPAGAQQLMADSAVAPSDPIVKTAEHSLAAQPNEPRPEKKGPSVPLWFAAIIGVTGMIVGLSGTLLRLWNRLAIRKDARIKKTEEKKVEAEIAADQQQKHITSAEQEYRVTLETLISKITLLGSPKLDPLPVDLLETFVPLKISEEWRSETRFNDPEMREIACTPDRDITQDEAIKHAFKNKRRVLLVIGDPGAGKTTLFYYYSMLCLKNDYQKLGFFEPVMPIYYPLRELEFDANKKPLPLFENLWNWAKNHALQHVDEQTFGRWVHEKKTLLLLDGLDEISDPEKRRNACAWIDAQVSGLPQACFAVSSRWTGYRADLGIQLGCDHLRVDVRDFTPEQQNDFLRKWFSAAFTRDLDDRASQQEKTRILADAETRAGKIIVYLGGEQNKSLRDMAAVPMILQIMALLWKDRDYLPRTLCELYEASLHYLLGYRDTKRNIPPPLPVEQSQAILSIVALWMQEDLQKDTIGRDAFRGKIKEPLSRANPPVDLDEFCDYIHDRSGVIAKCGKDHYIFRHKSFREYLAGGQLALECKQGKRLEKFVRKFGDDWWEETFRFLVRKAADGTVFKAFVEALFQSLENDDLTQKEQNLLQTIVKEAPWIDLAAFETLLHDTGRTDNQHRYVLECLKTAGSNDAYHLIERYRDSPHAKETAREYAREICTTRIIAGSTATAAPVTPDQRDDGIPAITRLAAAAEPNRFLNPVELNAEYILIPGGSYRYSVTKQMVTVPDLYFAKYPVTNRQFGLFTDFLKGKNTELAVTLRFDDYAGRFSEFIDANADLKDSVPPQPDEWRKQFVSNAIDDKRFNGPEQPVVRITWYAARAYCFWLSYCFHAASMKQDAAWKPEHGAIFRLPVEQEWEWAAAGREPDGSLRQYPWPKIKGEPNEKLANFDRKVGATTPVGRYPEGATPEGLMDIAGNVWEWMGNKYREGSESNTLRGGSWHHDSYGCRCGSRNNSRPSGRYGSVGFRCARITL